MGEDFIAFSFKVAEEVDPSVKLYYNDFNIERYINDKIRATHALVKRAKESGARVDGIGMQDHARVGNAQSKKELMDTMAFFSEVVDELAYTEVDIRHTKMPVTEADREQQAKDYMEVVAACLETEKCVGISVWDFTDQVCFSGLLLLLLCPPLVNLEHRRSTPGSPTSFQVKEMPASTTGISKRNLPTTASSVCFRAPPKQRQLPGPNQPPLPSTLKRHRLPEPERHRL